MATPVGDLSPAPRPDLSESHHIAKTLVENRGILDKETTTICFQPVELSCKSEYALLAMMELAASYGKGEPLQIRQIAAQQNIPDRYLEQLLATLRRCGLVRSQRGAKGGYILAREPWKITLLEVITCLEGSDTQPAENDSAPKTVEGSVICEVWQEAHRAANAVLQKYTLQDLQEKRDARRQLDIMYYI